MSGQVIGGDAVPPGGMEGGDWRSQLQQEYRQLIVNKIMEQLKSYLPCSGQEGLQELKKIVVRYEEMIYSAATSQSEYIRRICLKMLSMETKYQNPMANSLQSNAAATSQNPQDPGNPPHISFSEEDLEEIKVVDRSDRTYNTIQYNRVLKEKIKFKKWDPKLKALASAKKAKSPPPPLEAPSQKKQKGIVISEDPKRRKLTSPHVSSLEVRAPQAPSSLPLEPHPNGLDLRNGSSQPSSSNVALMHPFLEAVNELFVDTPRPSSVTPLGKVWASSDSTIRAVAAQFDVIKDLMGCEEKVAALEKNAIEAEANSAKMAKTLEEREASLLAKKAQLGGVMLSEDKKYMKVRELRLISTNLHQCLDAQEEHGKKLAASIEDLKRGVGLDFESFLKTPAFEDIRLYLLRFGSEQTIKKLKAKYPNLNLTCLDEEDEEMADVVAINKQEHEVDPGSAAGMWRRELWRVIQLAPMKSLQPSVEGDQLVDRSNAAPVI